MIESGNPAKETTRPMRLARRMFLTGIVMTGVMGCNSFLSRSQSPDQPLSKSFQNDLKEAKAGYIIEMCKIFGGDYRKTEGIGLAFGLNETGSNPKPGAQREHLKKELSGQSLEADPEKLISAKDTELVLLKGFIPPGAKKGDRFDIEVGTMPSTEATSIEYGMVAKARMMPFEMAGRNVRKGNLEAMTEGRVLVDSLFESRKDERNQLRGFIPGGGTVIEDRELGLLLSSDDASTKLAINISKAINGRFTFADKAGHYGIAIPKNDRFVTLVVANEYQFNLGRFLDVVTNIVYAETTEEALNRMEKLEKELADVKTAELAACRLEAMGKDATPILKRALRHDNLELKFYAAEALAYMDEPDGISHLELVAEKEPALRWKALTALSSINDPEVSNVLINLMNNKSAETRYGAFQALLNHSPNHPLAQGKNLGDFKMHQIPGVSGQPMIHFSRKKRAEIVLFGENQTVSEDFLYVQPNLTIKGTRNGNVSITKHSVKGDQKMVITNQLSDLIETLYRQGFTYSDQLKVFTQAKNAGTLKSRLVINALPKLGRTYVPGQFTDETGSAETGNDESLMDSLSSISKSAENNGKDSSEGETDEAKTTSTSKWKNWFTGGK